MLTIGSITSYISYTGKLTKVEAENEVLRRQNDACQVDLESTNQQLLVCSDDLESISSDLTRMTLDYQTSQSNLQTCNDEKLTLSADLDLVSEELSRKESQYNKLEDDLDIVSCNYAKTVCGSVDMEYYYLENNEKLVCCLNEDTCVRSPSGGEEVRKIEC